MTAIARKVPLLDLQAQHRKIRDDVLREVIRVIDSQKFILGDDVGKLERDVAAYCGCTRAIGCANGSDALVLALMAMKIGPGDEVLTAPYSFFATAGSISRVGAVPVFADVAEATFNLDIDSLRRALDAHPRVRAIMPVHLFGGCADMDPIMALARERGIPVVEDAAQAIGAEYNGRRAGSMGHIGCFSFFPSKNLGGYGDGGILTTSDDALAERLTVLRTHGSQKKYVHEVIGFNSRLDTLQAAVLRVKLPYLDRWTAGRQRNAELYRTRLATRDIPVTTPAAAPYQTRHIYNQFVIRAERRDALQNHLKEHGVGSEVYYPQPLHLQPCYAFLGHRPGDFPVSERLAKESLALPIYPELEPEDIDYVCQAIQSFYA